MTTDTKTLLRFSQSLSEATGRIREERHLQVGDEEVSDALTLRVGWGDERFQFTSDQIYESVRDFDFSGFQPVVKLLTNVERARAYLIGELADGTSLAKLTLERIDFHAGAFFMIVPKRIDPDHLQNLTDPNTDPRRYTEFRDEIFGVHFKAARILARIVRAFAITPNYRLFGQDTLMTLDGVTSHHPEMLSAAGKEWVSYQNEVYSFTRGDSSEEELETAISTASMWPCAVFLCRGAAPPGASKLQYRDLEIAVANLAAVAVGANHEDTFLLWWRDPTNFPMGVSLDDC
jgi:hypothetical protein